MKKLLCLAVGAFAALSMNAASIYVVGSGDGLNWTPPGKVINSGADGKYTFTIDNLSEFKFSKNNSSVWDGEGNYNAGCYRLNGSFNDAVYSSASGQTVSLVSGDSNITLPWTGSYTITISSDFTTITAKTTTPKPTAAVDVYIKGGMNSWENSAAWKMNYDSATDSYSLNNVTIAAGTEFKFADSGSWSDVNYGGSSLTVNGQNVSLTWGGDNLKMPSAFTGNITFKITSPKSTAVATFTPSGMEPEYSKTMYVLGNLPNCGWDPTKGFAMTAGAGAGQFTAQVEILDADSGYGYFSFAESLSNNSSDWNGLGQRYGGTDENIPVSLTAANTLTLNGNNSFKIPAGTYNFSLDIKNMTLLVSEVEVEGPEYPEHVYLFGGAINGWVTNQGIELTNEGDGQYVAENITVTSDNFAIVTQLSETDSDWEYVNANRYGPAEDNTQIVLEDEMTFAKRGENSWKINAGTYTFTVSFEDMVLVVEGEEATVDPDPTPDTWNIVGDFNEWTFGEGSKFDSIEGDVYTTGTIESLSSFLIVDGNSWNEGEFTKYGAAENATITLGQEFNLTQDGGDLTFGENASVENAVVVFNKATMTVKVTGTLNVEEGLALYVGSDNLNGEQIWDDSEDAKMTFVSENVYKWEGETLGSGFKIHSADWSEYNIGSNGSNKISLNTPYEYGNGDNILFENFGTVTNPVITLDLEAGTITLAGEAEIIEKTSNWYIVGSNVNGASWSNGAADANFTDKGNGVFEWTGTTLGNEFKITDGTWQTAAVGTNGSDLTLGTPYNYALEVNSGNIKISGVPNVLNNPKVVLDTTASTVTVTGEISTEEPELVFYMIGANVNGKTWALAAEDAKFSPNGEGKYKWEGQVLGTGFKVNDGTWSNGDYNLGAPSNGGDISMNTPYTYWANGSSGNISFDGFTTLNNPVVELDLNAGTITLTGGTPEGEAEWFITGFNATYVLDETSKMTPSETEGIYTISSIIIDVEMGDFKVSDTGWSHQYGTYRDAFIDNNNLSAVLEEVSGEAGGVPYQLAPGQYSAEWNMNTLTVTFKVIGTLGVDTIGAEDEEAAYFTLQGVKVKNPEKGQIYIKIAGGKAEKIVK